MKSVYGKAISQSIFGVLFFVALIYFSAGTFDYWQGWLFLAVFSASTTLFTIYLAIYDKPLLERRMAAGPWQEKEISQKIIVSLVIVAFFVFIVAPIVDYRLGLSPVPAYVSFVGDALIIASFLFIFWVLRVNSFAAANISVAADQQVISSGPYAYVRHPMYAGAIWLFFGMPLALGSWYSLILIIPFMPILIWRLLDEEKILHRDLPGYTAYAQRVQSRLIPGLW